MKILSGTSNLKLSKDIAKNLKLKLINTNIRRFADGEIYIEINENIRGNVYLSFNQLLILLTTT